MAAPTDTPSPLVPGYKLDRYELLCPIADGGMASVWAARQRGKHGFEKLVAIKTILPKFASDPRFQEMFLDEARIASRIEHVNAAHIFDLGEENETLYLVMEYVEGDALSKLTRSCQRKGLPLPFPIVLRILADACSGLHEAHDLRDAQGRPLEIVHRDVSPHNILVSTRGMAKVIDFGIAKARLRGGSDTNSGVLRGKVQYMSPEQALGRTVDRRADVWAVGAVLYQILAGRPPYDADSQLASLHLLRSGRPPAPMPPTVPAPIASLVRKALSYAPEQRYGGAAELREAIERVMVEARLSATTANVASFVVQHLSDRIEKRRAAIDVALVEAAERSRTRGLSEAKVQALLSSPAPVRPPPGPAPTITSGAHGSEPPRHRSESYATLGLAALGAASDWPVARSRKLLLVLGGALGVGVLLASLTLRSESPATREARADTVVVAKTVAAGPATLGSSQSLPTEPPAAAADPAESESTAIGPATAPSHTTARAQIRRECAPTPPASPLGQAAPVAAPPAPPATSPAEPEASLKSRTIDDGF